MARQSFHPGVPTYCGAPVFDPDSFEGIRDACTSTAFTVTRELWDNIDQVVVGTAICIACGASHLYARLATREEEIGLKDAPMHLVLVSGIDWP